MSLDVVKAMGCCLSTLIFDFQNGVNLKDLPLIYDLLIISFWNKAVTTNYLFKYPIINVVKQVYAPRASPICFSLFPLNSQS